MDFLYNYRPGNQCPFFSLGHWFPGPWTIAFTKVYLINWQKSVRLVLILFFFFRFLYSQVTYEWGFYKKKKFYFVIEFLQYLLVFHKSVFPVCCTS